MRGGGVDPVGGDVFDAGLRALAWRGRIVVIGFVAGRIPEIASNYLLLKNISAVGMFLDSYRRHDPEWVVRVQAEIFDMWRDGRLKVPTIDAYPLEAFAEAATWASLSASLEAGGVLEQEEASERDSELSSEGRQRDILLLLRALVFFFLSAFCSGVQFW